MARKPRNNENWTTVFTMLPRKVEVFIEVCAERSNKSKSAIILGLIMQAIRQQSPQVATYLELGAHDTEQFVEEIEKRLHEEVEEKADE